MNQENTPEAPEVIEESSIDKAKAWVRENKVAAGALGALASVALIAGAVKAGSEPEPNETRITTTREVINPDGSVHREITEEIIPNPPHTEVEDFEAEEKQAITQDTVDEFLASVAEENPESVLKANDQIEWTGTVTSVEYVFQGDTINKTMHLIDGSSATYELEQPGIKAVNHPEASDDIVQPDDNDPREILNHILELRYFAFNKYTAWTDDEFELRLLQATDIKTLPDVAISVLNRAGNLPMVSLAEQNYAENVEVISSGKDEYEVMFDEIDDGELIDRLHTVLRKNDEGQWQFAEHITRIQQYE